MKTKAGAKKRFKVTGSGKIKRKHAFKSHILTKKGTKQKRNLTKTGLVHDADVKSVKESTLYINRLLTRLLVFKRTFIKVTNYQKN